MIKKGLIGDSFSTGIMSNRMEHNLLTKYFFNVLKVQGTPDGRKVLMVFLKKIFTRFDAYQIFFLPTSWLV